MRDAACCTRLDNGDASPFEIAMLGWWDGLTSGMARCRACGLTYHFEMVAWDSEQAVRVYGFREVSRESYAEIVALNANPPGPDESLERSNALTLLVRNALATSLERRLYIAAEELDKKVVAARRIEFLDWKNILRF